MQMVNLLVCNCAAIQSIPLHMNASLNLYIKETYMFNFSFRAKLYISNANIKLFLGLGKTI